VNVSKHYAGERGQAYAASKQPDPLGFGYAIDFEYFRPYLKHGDVALDFGCGNGGILRHVARHTREAHGLEVNAAAMAMARAQNLTVFPSLEALPNEPRYDVILSNHVLEHLRDVCGTLEQLRERLKPGGRLVVKLPIDDHRTPYQRAWSPEDSDHHIQTWTPRLFANVLFESGYEVDECRVITSAWHPKLFPLARLGLGKFAFWLLAVVKSRRQLFAVARNPQSAA
jgi:2-polyprenyl-3-methyl-5-hydroxy-6-metoxy-1,4-benzoquinol methylase